MKYARRCILYGFPCENWISHHCKRLRWDSESCGEKNPSQMENHTKCISSIMSQFWEEFVIHVIDTKCTKLLSPDIAVTCTSKANGLGLLYIYVCSPYTIYIYVLHNSLSTEENKLNMDVIFKFVRETARFSTVPFVVR